MWHRRYQFIAVFRLLINRFKSYKYNILNFFGVAKEEIKGDIDYSLSQLTKQFKQASRPTSFKSLLRSSSLSLYNILKRFFTINTIDDSKNDNIDFGGK